MLKKLQVLMRHQIERHDVSSRLAMQFIRLTFISFASSLMQLQILQPSHCKLSICLPITTEHAHFKNNFNWCPFGAIIINAVSSWSPFEATQHPRKFSRACMKLNIWVSGSLNQRTAQVWVSFKSVQNSCYESQMFFDCISEGHNERGLEPRLNYYTSSIYMFSVLNWNGVSNKF